MPAGAKDAHEPAGGVGVTMNKSPDLDTRLDEALDESFPASDPPAVHSIAPPPTKKPAPPEVPAKPAQP
jgi:hypothetical protein